MGQGRKRRTRSAGREDRRAAVPRREPPPEPARAWRLLDGLGLAALLALAIAWASMPLGHDDLFGHLRTGEWIVAHGAVPRTDPFSFTRPGAPWITHEWGFSLLAWLVWRLGGLPALIAAMVLLVLATGLAVARRMLAEAGPESPRSIPWLAGLLALGLWAVAEQLILRAALLSELFLALALLLLSRFRQTGERRSLIALPVLFLLWGNLHSGVVFGLYVLALQALEALLAGPAARRWPGLASMFRTRPPQPYLLALGASALASLLNPNGWQVWLYPFKLSRLLFAGDIPWQMGHFAAAGPQSNTSYLLLLALLILGSLPPRRLRELSFAEILGLLTFFLLSFRTLRFVFHFTILALPALYRLYAGRFRSPALRRVLGAAVPAVLVFAAVTLWAHHPRRTLDARFPEGAVRFLEKEGIQGRIFHHQNYGGFLSWRARVPTFWDGRNDVFASLAREVSTTPFPQIADRYGIDMLLVTDFEYRGVLPLIPAQWGLVYWDDFSALYLRRDRFGPLLDRLELRIFPGFGGRPGLRELVQDPALAATARGELDRVLAFWPENQRALYFRARLSLFQGDLDGARRDLEAALAIRDSDVVRQQLDEIPGARKRGRT
jgi:hypothetical protein